MDAAELEQVARWYSTEDGFYADLVGFGMRAVEPSLRGRTCLELGAADGRMTGMLLDRFDRVVSVDGSQRFVSVLQERYGHHSGFAAVHGFFETVRLRERFDTVVAAHILEHLDDPVLVLRRAREWVAPGGVLIALVPNADSLHRRVAMHMGLLAARDALNDLDLRLGHRRVYDPTLLARHAEAAGWHVVGRGGSFLKPLANGQMAEWFSPEMAEGFFRAGAELPELCAEIFVVCE